MHLRFRLIDTSPRSTRAFFANHDLRFDKRLERVQTDERTKEI